MLTHYGKVVLATLFMGFRSVYFGFLRLTAKPIPWTFVVLMYHTVKREEVANFSRQLDLLRKYTHVVAADFSETDALPAGRYVALTFDDGFESFERNVLPVLREKRIQATVFVATRYIGQSPGWITDQRQRGAKERLLGEEELKALLKDGIASIGSHSVSHCPLRSSVLRADEIRFELESSKQYLEEKLARPITLFALPYGAFDEQVLQLAKEAGYHRVFLSIPLGSLTNIDGHVAGRLDASPADSSCSYWRLAQGAYQFLPLTIAAKARLLKWARRILRLET
jgi:peptidoglycan/xylan/chitin deacetylase (PgdA/CDA1 family)